MVYCIKKIIKAWVSKICIKLFLSLTNNSPLQISTDVKNKQYRQQFWLLGKSTEKIPDHELPSKNIVLRRLLTLDKKKHSNESCMADA